MPLTIETKHTELHTAKVDAVIITQDKDAKSSKKSPCPHFETLDKALNGAISLQLKNSKTFESKLGQTLVVQTHGQIPAQVVIILGLGETAKLTPALFRRASASAVKCVNSMKLSSAMLYLDAIPCSCSDIKECAQFAAEGFILGSFQFIQHKTDKNCGEKPCEPSITKLILNASKSDVSLVKQGAKVGEIIANATNKARALVFESANFVTPTVLAEFAMETAKLSKNISCKVFDEKEISKLKMGSFLSVSKGSEQPPKFIHITYTPTGKAKKKIALVGKGITFDSGGYSLKPAKSMELMKDDMAGAAAVLCTMHAIAELEAIGEAPKHQVDVLVPTCENMVNGKANKPGDIVTAMSGTTIEINNTDAEGRLILCDALTYAQQKIKPDELLDLATLTGACIIALGKVAAGIMGTDDDLINRIKTAGETAGEKFWQLPLYDEYTDFLKSPVADVMNAGNNGEAGSQAGGMFLKHFIENGQKWAHLDIAGPAYTDKDTPEVPKGGTGFGIRTLMNYLLA